MQTPQHWIVKRTLTVSGFTADDDPSSTQTAPAAIALQVSGPVRMVVLPRGANGAYLPAESGTVDIAFHSNVLGSILPVPVSVTADFSLPVDLDALDLGAYATRVSAVSAGASVATVEIVFVGVL